MLALAKIAEKTPDKLDEVVEKIVSGEAKNVKDVEKRERKEKLKVQQGQASGSRAYSVN